MQDRTFEPVDLSLFNWLWNNTPKCKFNLSKNNMPDEMARRSPIDFSFESYEKNRSSAQSLLKEALSSLYRVPLECIIPTLSGSQAIYVAMLRLRQLTSSISIPSPEYEPISTVAESLGFSISRIDLIRDGKPSLNDTIACSLPNNPLGTSPSSIWKHAESSNSETPGYYDETFSEFREKKGTTVFNEKKNVITSSTMVKYYGLSDLKVGWIFSPSEHVDWFRTAMQLVTPVIPPYNSWISYQALKNKAFFDKEVPEFLKQNIEIVSEFVDNTHGIEWEKPEGTSFSFIHVKTDNSEQLCLSILEKTGVLLGPGRYFGEENGFRLCYTIEPEKVKEALDLVSDYFESHYG